MYRRDYVLRLIEKVGRMLIAMRNHILAREVESADVAAQMREVAAEAGLDLDLARRLDPGSLLMWIAPTDDFDAPRLWLLAELLYLEALEARTGAEGDGGRADFARALALFTRLPSHWRPSEGLAAAGERVMEIRETLNAER